HPPVDLGCDDDLIAAGEIFDRSAEDLLAAAEGIAVRRVEEIDAALERPLDEGAAVLLADAPGMVAPIRDTIAHAAQTDPRYLQTRATELHIFHHSTSCQPSRPLRRAASGRSRPASHSCAWRL